MPLQHLTHQAVKVHLQQPSSPLNLKGRKMINPLFAIKTFFLSLLLISSTLTALICEFCDEPILGTPPCCFSQPLLEVKTGYFFFSNSKMQKIYDKGGWDVQLCASYPLRNLTSRWIVNAYCALEYFQRSGKSINDHQKTSGQAVPVNIGLKSVYSLNENMQYYFTIGPRYFCFRQHNNSAYVDKNKSKKGLGFFVNTGLNYRLCGHFVVDIFGEYSYAKIHFHSGNSNVYTRGIQVGGLTFGAGLGYEF
jgi:hypothetical protein